MFDKLSAISRKSRQSLTQSARGRSSMHGHGGGVFPGRARAVDLRLTGYRNHLKVQIVNSAIEPFIAIMKLN